MNKRMYLVPCDWECSLEDCPPGPFAANHGKSRCLGFKSEYRTDAGKIEAYNEAGEFYCGEGLVIPLRVGWEEE